MQSRVKSQIDRRQLWLGGGVVLVIALAYHLAWIGRVPPGLDRDAAANGWLALKWLRYGLVPFWMPHASAPEPLIVWLQTATTALLGPSVVALRVASALFLAFAALITYWLTWEVAKFFVPAQRWWAALLAGLVFACNPVVTQLARTGLRATTLPLLSALFFLLLLRAWRTNARRDYALSGLVLGLAAYTYLAARFLPIVIVVFVALAWWSGRKSFRLQQGNSALQSPDNDIAGNNWARLVGLGVMGLVALVMILPQVLFFVAYPAAFLERAQSVSLFANPEYAEAGLAGLLLDKVTGMLLMFGVEWWGQYNQAARPLLAPLPFVGLLLSLPLVWQWRRRPAMLLMVVAGGVLLLPDLIGGDRVRPHELRVIGAFVPIMVLSGVGLAHGVGWLVRLVHGRGAWHLTGATVALLVVGWGVVEWFGVAAPTLAQSDYEWYARPDVALAQMINLTGNTNDAPMLVPLNEYSRSVVAYLTAKRITHLRSGIAADGTTVQPSADRVLLVWPADPSRTRTESASYRFDAQSLVLIDGDRAYLMPPARADVTQLQGACATQPTAFALTTATGEAAGALCEVDFAAFEFPAQWRAVDAEPSWRVSDTYNEVGDQVADEALRLRGIDADGVELQAGATVGITSYWQATPRTQDHWRYFVHVLDDRQAWVAGDDLIPGYGVYGTRIWQMDEIVPIRQVVQLPPQLAPGRYWIQVGLYDPLNYARAVVDGAIIDGVVTAGAATEGAATRTLVGPLKVPLQASAELANATPLVARFGDEIALDGFGMEKDAGTLHVSLRLTALRPPAHDYTVFVHVENAAGELVAQADAQPLDGQYPTAIWDAGETVLSTWHVALPPTLPVAGEIYRVWIGLYEWQSGARLPVDADGAAGARVDADRLLLGEIVVE